MLCYVKKTHVYRVAGMIASIREKKPHVYCVIILKQMADHTKQGARQGRSVRLVCETALRKKHAIRLCQTRILSIYRCSPVCLNNLRMRYVQQIFLVRSDSTACKE